MTTNAGCGLVTSKRGGDKEVSKSRRAGDGDRGGRKHVGGEEAEQCEAEDWRDKKLRKGFTRFTVDFEKVGQTLSKAHWYTKISLQILVMI